MPGPMRPRRNMSLDRAKDFRGSIKKLFKNYLFKYKWSLLIVFIFAVGSTIFTIVGPKILGNATTEIFNGLMSKLSGGSGINFENIAHILITLMIIYVISMSFQAIQGFVMTSVSQKMTYRMRNDLISNEIF